MKVQHLGIVLALASCGTSAPKADWEYTKWGMTPQQVLSASKNLATPGTDLAADSDGNVSKLVAPYQSGKFSFEAQFGFDAADRLASVTLVLDDKSANMEEFMNMGSIYVGPMSMCHDLQASLNAAYGLADHGGASHFYGKWYWQDQKNKNNVTYTVLYNVGCYVQYSAIK